MTMPVAQLSLLPDMNDSAADDWTFDRAQTRDLTHCYHDYPARMIPQISRRLLRMLAANKTGVLFDPYCGTGTSLVEGFVGGFDVFGTDLNPLARLIAKAKTSIINLQEADFYLSAFNRCIKTSVVKPLDSLPGINGISRLDFWFKPDVIEKLTLIKNFVAEISSPRVKLFFQVAFSETVRESSNTRNNEFKLYRYDDKTLENFQPNVFAIMLDKLSRNYFGLKSLLTVVEKLPRNPLIEIFDFDTVFDVPENTIPVRSVDIVITSPPYGDTHTTVAYGQYSRLSAAWLDLPQPEKTDANLMGSRRIKAISPLECAALNATIERINRIDEKRAREVYAFYADLQKSIFNVSRLVKPNGFVCYVVGNRTVKGEILPTNLAVKDFFEANSFVHRNTFLRRIPNKRMPARNSPSNVSGQTEKTMLNEHIVILQNKKC